MSVASKNPFALLDEETSRPSSPAAAAAAAAPAPAPTASQPSRGNQRSRGGGPASRGGRYYDRGGGGNKNTDSNRETATTVEPAAGTESNKRRCREGREGRGRGRGNRGGARGRAFDRHSGTGKTDSEKKVHQSWGGDDGSTELKVEEAATNDAAAESAGAATNVNDWAADTAVNNDWGASGEGAPANNDWGTSGDGAPADDPWGQGTADASAPAPTNGEGEGEGGKTESRRRDKEDEEDNTLTLDQYLAQQKEKESGLLQKLEARRANEGSDDHIWEGATRLEKGEGDAYFAGKNKTTTKVRAEKKEKVYIEIEPRFDRPSSRGRGRGGGDRGDRGRGRGGRGRGRGGFSGNAASTAVNVDDESAFPSLS
ncbi:hypothetical protein EDD16DRAFT_1688736 [Pisolithus croceorrhizus]|nr:hypothetical protein EDD16DRAFT_1688736 [Pisolithus croceorrhizus]